MCKIYLFLSKSFSSGKVLKAFSSNSKVYKIWAFLILSFWEIVVEHYFLNNSLKTYAKIKVLLHGFKKIDKSDWIIELQNNPFKTFNHPVIPKIYEFQSQSAQHHQCKPLCLFLHQLSFCFMKIRNLNFSHFIIFCLFYVNFLSGKRMRIEENGHTNFY